MQVLHRTCKSLYAHLSTENKYNDSLEMFRTSGWHCCCPVMKSSGGEKKKSFPQESSFLQKIDFWHSCDSITVVCSAVKNFRAATSMLSAVWPTVFVWFCHLSSGGNVFSLILCSYSPLLSCWHVFCAEQAHLYIGSDIPSDKSPCSALWLCKCALVQPFVLV